MNSAFKLSIALAGFFLFSNTVSAQLNGTVTVPSSSYPNLASVISALNTQGVGNGGVVINITVSNPQTAPAGGYRLGSAILNASTTTARTIQINGNNNTVTAPVGTSAETDGIFILEGIDNLTIDGLNLQESPANTTAITKMEWGYALLRRNAIAPFDGCQNVLIQNCSITLDRSNAASTGIYGNVHTATSTTLLAVNTAEGINKGLRFFKNMVENCYTGIYLNGTGGVGAVPDTTVEVGRTGTGWGNIIQNYGGGTLEQTGIYVAGIFNLRLEDNRINNSGGGGVAGGNAVLTGIQEVCTGPVYILRNTVTLQQGTTGNASTVHGILDFSAGTGYTYIDGNTISGSGGGSGAWNGIAVGERDSISVSLNRFFDINLSTTGNTYLIHKNNTVTRSPVFINIEGNSTAGSAVPYCQKAPGGNFAFYYNNITGGNTTTRIYDNVIREMSVFNTTLFYGIYASDVSATGSKLIHNNLVENIVGMGSGSNVSAIMVASARLCIVDSNRLSNLRSGSVLFGIQLQGNTDAKVYKNKVTGLVAENTGGITCGISTTNNQTGNTEVYNNYITGLTAPLSDNSLGIIGIYCATGNTIVHSNTIVLGKTAPMSGGIGFSCAGVYIIAPTQLRNNIIYVNVVPSTNGISACIKHNNLVTPIGISPATTLFRASSNIYYINPGPQHFIFVQGNVIGNVKNGFGISGVNANAAININNDPQFNKTCSAYKRFMARNGEHDSYYEDNLTLNAAGYYVPSGSSYAKSGGVALVNDDFAGAVRAIPPDIGAFEFEATTMNTGPRINYVAVSNRSACFSAPVIPVTIAGVGITGVNTTTAAPRLYYRKTSNNNAFGTYPADNIAAFNGWKYVVATGTVPNFSFAIDYNLLFGPPVARDTIEYFVVAQDILAVPNVNIWRAGFSNGYCLLNVNIPPAAGSIDTLPPANRFVLLPPAQDSFITGSHVLCNGDSTVLTVPPATTYQWLVNGSPIAGATTARYIARTPGTYRAVITGTGACRDTSLAHTVTLYPTPVPVITNTGGVLSTGLFVTYQWQLNGVNINGATSATYRIVQNGRYTVKVTDVNGCTGTSAILNIGTDVSHINGAADILIYPNPAQNQVSVKAGMPVQVSICSMDGKLLLTPPDARSIDIGSLSNGLYLIRVTDNEGHLLRMEKLLKY